MNAELVPVDAQAPAIEKWHGEQLLILKRHIAKGCTDEELQYFVEYAARVQLNPLLGEIVAISRFDKRAQRSVMSIQVTEQGLLTLAERSGLFAGIDPPEWCGPDGIWHDVWLPDEPPAAARVAVYRNDWARPAVGIARYSSHVQLDKEKRPTPLWATGPDYMLAKCARSRALREAFPKEFTRAGVTTPRNLSDAQIVAVEARAAGLTDEERHELVAEVTDGRTESSRELTDPEQLKMRAEIVSRAVWQPEPPNGPPAGEPTFDQWYLDNGWQGGQAEHDNYKHHVIERLRTSTPESVQKFNDWRETQGIPRFNGPAHTRHHAADVSSNIDILVPEAPAGATTTAPAPQRRPMTVEQELVAHVMGRLELLDHPAVHAAFVDWCKDVGIDPERIEHESVEHLHAIDAYIDQEVPF